METFYDGGMQQDEARAGAIRTLAAPSLALTFLLLGLAYANPVVLLPDDARGYGTMGGELLNLYAVVAWMGLAHFVYAFGSQYLTLAREGRWKRFVQSLAGTLFIAAVLLTVRSGMSADWFNFLVWVYFIPHFVRAELHFAERAGRSAVPWAGWSVYWFPSLAFAYLTAVLFMPVQVESLTVWRCMLVGGAMLVVAAGIAGGVLRQLRIAALSPYALLAFFLVGEGLVWGAYRPYMTPGFQMGVYVFHIAGASFMHYLRGYVFAREKAAMQGRSAAGYIAAVLVVNGLVAAMCWALAHFAAGTVAAGAVDVRVFTFWVALHLGATDWTQVLREIDKRKGADEVR